MKIFTLKEENLRSLKQSNYEWEKERKAMFIVVCDPSMNELWVT